jgi:hypothetical protein
MGPEVNSAGGEARRINAKPRPIASQRQITVDDGDVVITLEFAGIWRGGPGLMAPTTQTLPEYRVSVRGETGVLNPIFEIYERAVADGDAVAANRKVRLFYSEGSAMTLLKDYRPDHRL